MATEKLQAKEELGSHSDASRSKELGKPHSFRVASKEKKKRGCKLQQSINLLALS